jgi:AcrR family transcriptional regulator
MLVQKSDKITEIQSTILDAAVERFQHFGIRKTTMAEIAADVHMSTANLYRYFRNKEDIAVACSRRCLDERSMRLQAVVESSQPADKKLQAFFTEILRYTYEQVSSSPRINELVNIIAEKYRDVVLDKNKVERSLIKRILEQGINEGIFSFEDIDRATIAVHTSMHLFQLPLSMTVHDLDTLMDMVPVTTELLLNGLRKK